MPPDTEQIYDPSKGWPLWEALERAANPDSWRAWCEARDQYAPLRGRRIIVSHQSTPAYSDVRRLRQAYRKTLEDLRSNLWACLKQEKWIGRGSVGRSVEHPTELYSGGWSNLVVRNWRSSILKERVGSSLIYNVRIFPFVHDPAAPTHLGGWSIVDAFRRCVLDDPEVVALSADVLKQGSHEKVFDEGQLPGPMIDFRWPLDCETDELAYGFVRPVAWFIDQQLPKATREMKLVARAMTDRWNGLRRLMANGKLVAWGTFTANGQFQAVNPLQWRRSGLYLDVQNGDLLEVENNAYVLKWTGLLLRADTTVAAAQSAVFSDLTPRTAIERKSPKTPTQEAISAAVAALWPTGVPKDMLKKTRNERISSWLREAGRLVPSDKSIHRYLDQ